MKGELFVEKNVSICEHDACVVRHALALRLKSVEAETRILRIARERDLTREERWQLPGHMQMLPREQLAEQVDAWITLEDTIKHLIQRFKLCSDSA